jgi:hypothetical protein
MMNWDGRGRKWCRPILATFPNLPEGAKESHKMSAQPFSRVVIGPEYGMNT